MPDLSLFGAYNPFSYAASGGFSTAARGVGGPEAVSGVTNPFAAGASNEFGITGNLLMPQDNFKYLGGGQFGAVNTIGYA
jgi:hypothetical protein